MATKKPAGTATRVHLAGLSLYDNLARGRITLEEFARAKLRDKVERFSLNEAASFLFEEGAPIDPTEPQPLPLETQNLSLDMKVDSYFMKYEKESLPTQQNYQVPGTDLGAPGGLIPSANPAPPGGTGRGGPTGGTPMMEGTYLGPGFKQTFQWLLEAEDDGSAPDDGAGDPAGGGDDPGGAAPAPGPQAPAVENPRFNVRNFAQSVGRLVLNFEGLLDPRTTILNRARAYIQKNYDAGVAQQMMEILQSQFQLSPRDPQDGGTPPTPVAAGAWSGVGGGGGG